MGSEGLIFLPYLTGERTPLKDPYARGGFIGLTIRHQRRHLVRAVLEGITFAMRDSLKSCGRWACIDEVRATKRRRERARSGSKYRRISSGVKSPPSERTRGPRSARPSWRAWAPSVYPSIPEACDAILTVVERTEPDPARVKEYEDYYQVYHSLYPGIREACHRLSKKVASIPPGGSPQTTAAHRLPREWKQFCVVFWGCFGILLYVYVGYPVTAVDSVIPPPGPSRGR